MLIYIANVMNIYDELYEQYDLLLPPKLHGGYLILALDEKIKQGDIEEPFKLQHIEETLTEINNRFQKEPIRQWVTIKDNILQYFIRNYPEEPGLYYLTDYAHNIIELMQNKLHSPYKDYPLKKSFELRFYIKFNEINSIEDLEAKFGRSSILFSKNVITHHIEALEDELREAYKTLNTILGNEEENAVKLVQKFAIAFAAFGNKATDITKAMTSKDKFLRDLQFVIDDFYSKAEDSKYLDDSFLKEKSIQAWGQSRIIQNDIIDFFKLIDNRITIIRRQINNASEKLSELQEYFSSRANFRLKVQKLLGLILGIADYSDDGIVFNLNFPLKGLVYERPKMLYLRHNEFDNEKPNIVIPFVQDREYEQQEREKIKIEIYRQQIINDWVVKAKHQLVLQKEVSIEELMNTILYSGQDLSIAYQVAAEMISFCSEQNEIYVDIEQKLITLKQNEMTLWKTRIKN